MKIKDNKGFTLIELMVTVAIIGILAAIAMPAYTQYVAHSKATDATNTLASTGLAMAQKLQDTGGYACVSAAWNDQYFNFTCVATATDFTVAATGTGSMSAYAYSFNASEQHTTLAHPSGATNNCWRISGTEC